MQLISGPWKAAILYVLNRAPNSHYDDVTGRQFFDLQQHESLPLQPFIEVLADNFTRYQRHVDGAYQIVPTQKQKAFLQTIVTAETPFHFSEVTTAQTPFHFSEVGSGTKTRPPLALSIYGIAFLLWQVGSGKTKVILPLLCQAFLSNNQEVKPRQYAN